MPVLVGLNLVFWLFLDFNRRILLEYLMYICQKAKVLIHSICVGFVFESLRKFSVYYLSCWVRVSFLKGKKLSRHCSMFQAINIIF